MPDVEISHNPDPVDPATPSRLRRLVTPIAGAALLFAGVGATLNTYREVNTPTTTSSGEEIGILDAAQRYLGPDGNSDRCIDERLADISKKIAQIPDDTANSLLGNGALDAQAEQFNDLGADNVTGEDLSYLLTHTPKTPDTQCNRKGGTSTAELINKAPFSTGVSLLGSFIIMFTAASRRGAARERKKQTRLQQIS